MSMDFLTRLGGGPVSEAAQAAVNGTEEMRRDNLAPIPVAYLEKGESVLLSPAQNAIRLTPVASGIGSLHFSGAHDNGIQAFAWEDHDFNGGIVIPERRAKDNSPACVSFTNRPKEDSVSLDLTKFSTLRRLVVASHEDDISVIVGKDSTIQMKTENGDHVMLVYRVGNEVEFRRESIYSYDLLKVFGIQSTHNASDF